VPFEIYDLGNQENVNIADKYGVRAIPTLIFINKDGSVSNQIIGLANKDTIEQNVIKIGG